MTTIPQRETGEVYRLCQDTGIGYQDGTQLLIQARLHHLSYFQVCQLNEQAARLKLLPHERIAQLYTLICQSESERQA